MVKSPPGPPMTLGDMRRLGFALIISLAPCAEATADVLTFAYPGTIKRSNFQQEPQARTFTVILDTKKLALTIDDYDPAPLGQGETGAENTLEFSGLPVTYATFNRITGELNFKVLGNTAFTGQGFCKPAQKLF